MLPPKDAEIWGLSAPAPAQSAAADARAAADPDACPLRFGSRLNSMRSRLDLVGRESSSLDLLEMVHRLGSAKGVDLVDFNYPQHLRGEFGADEIARALEDAGLAAGAVAVRFPAEPFRLGGAFTNPDPAVRAAAVDVVAEACAWAAALGATRGVIVWPQFDGYDYHFGANHASAWKRAARAIQDAVDRPECRAHRVSFEFKPTDPSARFATVSNTHAALALAREVARPGRFGLTLDLGHLLAAGENPAQSAAAALAEDALFGFHLGDAHSRLGAEDGLAFGSVHAAGALELVYTLRLARWDGHAYFDTFPEAEDPVREAEYNVRAFRRFWKRAGALERGGMGALLEAHDAMGALELIESLEA
jgi:sugar phosphate isomerase/epimerase